MSTRRDKVVELANSLLDVQKQFLDLALDFMPEDAKKHLRAARKEKLLALRALLDSKIKDLERQEKGGKKPQKVKVE
jgi:hypothetical protein